MGEEMSINGSSKFVLPMALFIALIAAIVAVVRLDTKVEFLIQQQTEEKRQVKEDIKVYGLEVNALRLEVARLQSQSSNKGRN